MDDLNRRDFLKGSLKAGTAVLGLAMIAETASSTLIRGAGAAEAAGLETGGSAATNSAKTTVRFPPIPPEQMTDAQKSMVEAIASGPRGGFRGPYGPLLYSPETGSRVQKVGEHLRYNSALPPRLSEFAILITGRFWTANYEWSMHRPQAIKAGLAESIIDDLLHDRRPAGMQKDEEAIYDFCTALHKKHSINDELFERATGLFGEQGIVDLIGLCGYYSLIAMVLNVAEIPAPPGGESPW